MKKCAYCETVLTGKNKTKEHVIPNSLIKFFPEQDITFTARNFYKDNLGLTVKDVCNKCNNGFLSELDDYGQRTIKQNFLREYLHDEVFKSSFDLPQLSRWLMKIAYNYHRCEKRSSKWFLENIEYIKGSIDDCLEFSLYAGLHVDMIPITERSIGYMPLAVYDNLIFKPFGNFKYEELLKGNLVEREAEIFKSLSSSFLFRFGSIRFLLLLWDKEITKEQKEINEIVMDVNFGNYSKISNIHDIVLKKVTDPLVCITPAIIHGGIGMDLYTQYIEGMVGDIQKLQETFGKFLKENPEGEALVESTVFPDNVKVQKKYNELFDKD